MTSSTDPKAKNSFLFGHFLAATPAVMGGIFEKCLMFISAHDNSGALGIMVNKELKNSDSKQMLESMGIKIPQTFSGMPLYVGGPVDTNRGFVIHSADYALGNTIKYPCGVSVSSERKVLQDYVDGKGPKHLILAMGYAGWVNGQIEQELIEGSWLSLPADKDVIFSPNIDAKWQKAAALSGIDINKIMPTIGLA